MRFILLLAALIPAGAMTSAHAQLIYRCDRVVQDRPCDPKPVTVHRGASTADQHESLDTLKARQYAEEERKQSFGRQTCSRFDQDLQSIYEAQARGTDNMDYLNRRIRSLEEERARAGC